MIYPDARVIAKKYAEVTPLRVDFYEDGVNNPKKNWETETLDAVKRYEEGIREAIKNKSFERGVKKAGTEKQKANTIKKGVPIWPDRVRAAEDDMATAMEPVVAAAKLIKLPQRYPKGDPRNIERVKAVMVGLHKLRTG